jgi:WD40 repeat protein
MLVSEKPKGKLSSSY